jgi:nondiscriminating aspartyl-tRNA synthetase
MERVLLQKLSSHDGQRVMIQGFLHNRNNKWKIGFLTIRDRSGFGMAIVESMDEIIKLEGLYTGTVLSITWDAVLEPMNKKYWVELKNPIITILEPVHHVHGIDITKEDLNLEIDAMIDNRVVTMRHPKQSAIFSIAAVVEKNMRDFFDDNDFTQINSPKLIGFPTEGGAEVFELNYFEKKAYLAQSPQFYKQMMVPIYERVYEIGRAYRAEKSNSSRHLSEILMLDVEMWFIDFEYLLNFINRFFTAVVKQTRIQSQEHLSLLWATEPLLPEEFPRITVANLHDLMFAEMGEDYRGEADITASEERFICDYSAKNRWSDAVIVTEFPWSESKFYHIQDEKNPDVAQRADLLFRGVEVATVPMRQTNYDKLVQQIIDRGYDPTNPWLADYLDSFKYGMPREGGFGFGISRLVQKLIWLSNIKEAELFPRDRNRLTP